MYTKCKDTCPNEKKVRSSREVAKTAFMEKCRM